MKVMGYRVITQVSTESLEKEVKKKIKDGWVLQGGACGYVHYKGPGGSESETGFVQALVKYKY